jgi:polar amino acid transport system permease protein
MSSASVPNDEQRNPNEPNLDDVIAESRGRAMRFGRLYTLPYWLMFLVFLGIVLGISILTDEIYSGIFDQLKEGVGMTIFVSVASYVVALMIAIFVGIVRSNPPAPPQTKETLWRTIKRVIQMIIYNLCTVYVSVMRGLPVLIVLLVTAFIIVPAIREFINGSVIEGLRTATNNPELADLFWRGSSAPSAIVALAVTYGAYMSETIRAGIQSIPKGQVEAAYSVGMTYIQTMRYIVLPQAFRNVLPPLGNDFVAMIKDSSLLAFLGVRDVTQVAKTSAGRSFRYVETYAIVAFIYLTLVIFASTIVNILEDTINVNRETPDFVLRIQRFLGNEEKGKREVESFD